MTRRRSAADTPSAKDTGSSDLVQLLPMDLWLRELQEESKPSGIRGTQTVTHETSKADEGATALDKEKAVRLLIDRLNGEA